MATFVGVSTQDGVGGALALTIAIPAAAIAGDLMIAFVKQSENTGQQIWDDDGGGGNGWIRVAYNRTVTGRDQETAVYWKFHTGTETDPTFTWNTSGTAEPMSGILAVYRDAELTEVQVLTGNDDANPPNPQVNLAATTDSVVVFHAATHDDISTPAAPTGYTMRGQVWDGTAGDHRNCFLADLLSVGSTGSYTPPAWQHSVLNNTPEYHCYAVVLGEAQFSVAGDVITQASTAVSPNLSALSLLGVASIQGGDGGVKRYNLDGYRLVVDGDMTIDPDFECLEFGPNSPFPNLSYSGTLRIGTQKINSQGVEKYSQGSAVVFNAPTNQDNGTAQNCLEGIANGCEFHANGGVITAPGAVCLGGSNGSFFDTVTDIKDLTVMFKPNLQGRAGQFRFDNTALSTVNVSGLTISSTVSETESQRAVLLFNSVFDSFSASFRGHSIQSYASQLQGLRFDDISFLDNFREFDLVANGGGEVLAFVDCDTGSATAITNNISNSCHFAFWGTARVQAFSGGSPLAGFRVFVEDADDGSRFLPIGDTSGIASLVSGYGSGSLNTYSQDTDVSGEADLEILMSTYSASTQVHSDYSNGGSLSDQFTVFGYKYGFVPASQDAVLRTRGGTPVVFVPGSDASISEASKTVVDSYASLDTAAQAYDRAASFLEDNWGTYLSFFASRSGDVFECAQLVIDSSAGEVFAYDGTTLTLLSSAFTSSVAATSQLSLLNGSQVAGSITTPKLVIDTPGTYVISGGSIDEIENTSSGLVEVETPLTIPALTNSGGGTIAVSQPVNMTIIGHPVGATIVVYDDDSADPQELGTELARFNLASASEVYTYDASFLPNSVVVTMVESTYKRYVSSPVSLLAVDFTFTIEPELETN